MGDQDHDVQSKKDFLAGDGELDNPVVHATQDYVNLKISEEEKARGLSEDALKESLQTVDSRLSRHIGDSTHVTPEDKARWDGKASLENGMIPASLLPSYVDDVIEAESFSQLPPRGEAGKIYVTLDENRQYRWSGSVYVEVSKSISLGETQSTAYPGDKGAKNAADIARLKDEKQDEIVGEQLNALNSGATKEKIDSIENKQDKLTEEEKSVLDKGPYLPTIGGGTVFGRNSEQGEPLGAEIKLDNLDGGGSVVEIKSGTQGGPASLIVGDGASGPASIRKGDREVATEELVNGLAQYPIKAVVGNALLDRTVNTSTGGAFTFPTANVGARDFVVVIAPDATEPAVSFPLTGFEYFSDDENVWTAAVNAVNVWYFTEIGENQFMVAHKALTATTQA